MKRNFLALIALWVVCGFTFVFLGARAVQESRNVSPVFCERTVRRTIEMPDLKRLLPHFKDQAP